MDKALLIGVNTYPDAPLSGCVNDITDMADFLAENVGFDPDNISLLADRRATTAAIRKRLAWLVDVKPGDRVFFQFSGHGVQLPSRNKRHEVDSLDEAICPVEFDWSDERVIRDDELAKIFARIPKKAIFCWVSDSCHSGDLTRGLSHPHAPKPRSMMPPPDVAWRFRSVAKKGLQTPRAARTLLGKEHPTPGAFLSGCRSDQTSADAFFDGRPNGALTYHLLRVLSSPHGLSEPMSEIVKSVRSGLKRGGYTQIPQLEGDKKLFTKPFLNS